jgi:hypothetical protein
MKAHPMVITYYEVYLKRTITNFNFTAPKYVINLLKPSSNFTHDQVEH